MKNTIECNICHHENPLYFMNCEKCNAYLHSRIANIDLWDTLWNIIESPIKAAEIIIQSDHKNFLVTILLLISFKIGLNALTISNAFSSNNGEERNGLAIITYSAIIFITVLLALSLIITQLHKLYKIRSRFKDNLAIFTYSFLPMLVFFAVITPIQIALFGTYWFSFNPSPLIFKPMSTYVIFILEILFYMWSGILFITSMYTQSRKLVYSIITGLGTFIILLSSILFAV